MDYLQAHVDMNVDGSQYGSSSKKRKVSHPIPRRGRCTFI
jgi:hypothetical protein